MCFIHVHAVSFFFMFSQNVTLQWSFRLLFLQWILPVAVTKLYHMNIDLKALQFRFILCHIKERNQPNRHVSIPFIVVWLVVPDFWSNIIWGSNVCMSISLWAATQFKVENVTAANKKCINLKKNKTADFLFLYLFRIHAEPKSPSLIVPLSVRKMFCVRKWERSDDLAWNKNKSSQPWEYDDMMHKWEIMLWSYLNQHYHHCSFHCTTPTLRFYHHTIDQ